MAFMHDDGIRFDARRPDLKSQSPARVITDPADLAACERLEAVARDILARNMDLFAADGGCSPAPGAAAGISPSPSSLAGVVPNPAPASPAAFGAGWDSVCGDIATAGASHSDPLTEPEKRVAERGVNLAEAERSGASMSTS